MSSILVLNGPNLNMLGKREPSIYGLETLHDIQLSLETQAQQVGMQILFEQSNNESSIIDHIHQAMNRDIKFIIINPAAFTHTSVAIRDALLSVSIPFIELHLSNTYARESFRHHSYFSDIATGVIIGLGSIGYNLALTAAIQHIQKEH
jgi:3-dehydroquinate dehydratase-2